MSGGQIALVIVLAVVTVLVVAVLVVNRSTPDRPPTAKRSRHTTTADSLVEDMRRVHVRIRDMVAEGRTTDARKMAKALIRITERDPDAWIRDVTEQLRAPDGPPALDFGTAKRLAAEGHPIAAIREYRRITGAGLQEAKKVVDAMTIATDRGI